ncbi:flagellar biosynthesis regulator FlaF [Inquilinus limosus]|uniref:flagellar biosynthesis regulator FlaF n=1 Tax=Inquilinus limosus TaxID=171674 RepID=UPI0003F89B9A|nr:flagellar biosynthesis regulator FlaF [Inquilinus limosus]
MSIAAYTQTIKETETPRQIERRVVTQVTAALERHAGAGPASPELREALTRNQRLWGAFRADLVDDGNGLPPGLRAGLISLSFWVDRHTLQVLGGAATAEPLIDVNRKILAGLRGQV